MPLAVISPATPCSTDAGNRFQDFFDIILEAVISLTFAQPGQITFECTHRRRNGHLVIVEDDNELCFKMPGLVDRLARHARHY